MASNKRLLKAYIRYDGNGRVIPGSPIMRQSAPKDGHWHEINAYLCCNTTTTTSTTQEQRQ
jgi:hypothetical protein